MAEFLYRYTIVCGQIKGKTGGTYTCGQVVYIYQPAVTGSIQLWLQTTRKAIQENIKISLKTALTLKYITYEPWSLSNILPSTLVIEILLFI